MANGGNTVRKASNVCSVIYFVLILLPWALLLEPFTMIYELVEIFGAFGGTVAIELEAIQSTWTIFLCIFATVAFSLVIPGLWPMYRKLPWLLPYVLIGLIDVFILALDMQILYASGSVLLTVLFLVVARAIECFLLYLRPIPAMRARRTPVTE